MPYIPVPQFSVQVLVLKKKIWERDDYTCKYCGLYMGDLYLQWKRGEIKRKDALITVDHVIPKNPYLPWRDWRESNLVTACSPCNREKGGWKNYAKTL